MILGIGTDITNIERIAAALRQHEERFLSRCFTEGERGYVEGLARGDFTKRASGYAKRWAAKEACAKALGLGVRDGVYLRDMAVISDHQGKPVLCLTGGAKERLTALTPKGMTARADLSLSDEYPLALAFVVLSVCGGDI